MMEAVPKHTEERDPNNKISFTVWAEFIAILFFDFILNSYQLLSQSIRLDEAQSIWASTKSVSGIIGFLSTDVAAPLYAILLHFWIQIFGPDIFYARILSLIFFLLTLPVLYLMSKEASNKKVAMLTVVLFSLSPFIMWYTSEARMYTLFTFVTSLNHLYFLRIIRSGGKIGKIGYFMTTIFGLFTHYFFVFLLMTQGTYMVLMWAYRVFSDDRREKIYSRIGRHKDLPLLVLRLIFFAFLFFVPWLIFVAIHGGAANTQPLIPAPTTFNIFQAFVNFLFGFQTNGVQGVLISLWPLAVIFLFFIFTQKKRNLILNVDYFVLATFLPIIIDFLGSYIKPIFLSRYLILTTPTLFFLLAWVLINNTKKVSSYLIGGVIFCMLSLMVYQNVSAQTPVKEDYRGVSAYLEQQVKPGDIIAVSAPFTIYPIEYTYHTTTRIDTIPLWSPYTAGAIPPYSQSALAAQIKNYATLYNRMFVVLSYDQGYQDKIIKYLDTHYKRLALKDFSPGLQVRVYQLRYD